MAHPRSRHSATNASAINHENVRASLCQFVPTRGSDNTRANDNYVRTRSRRYHHALIPHANGSWSEKMNLDSALT